MKLKNHVRNNDILRKRWMIGLLIFTLSFLFILTGCGRLQTDAAFSPELQEIQTRGGCRGGEKDQYIKADLVFNHDIGINPRSLDNLRITIGSERIRPENVDFQIIKDKTLEITIPVQKVTSGKLEISPDRDNNDFGITDHSGKYAARYFEISTIVPSGAQLGPPETGENSVSADVLSAVNHRSIIWIRITEDGNAIIPDASGTDRMKDAFAVHEHDFLWADEKSTAADIADAVCRYFPDRLTAEAAGNTVTIHSVSNELAGTLGIEIIEN